MNVLNTIIPVFAVIVIGCLARYKGFMPVEFLGPANRLIYYFAIPVMIFRAISKASLKAQFNAPVLAATLFSVLLGFLISWRAAEFMQGQKSQRGTFMQSSFHGNLGYIGLAVAYYYLGSEGLVRASIIAGFIMIVQNFLAVIALQLYSNEPKSPDNFAMLWKILGNPVIIAAILGIIFSLAEIKMPLIISQSFDILGGLGLPMALLIIGASLSFKLMKAKIFPVLISSLIKLLIMPAVGFLFYKLGAYAPKDYLPALIILASPTATITYVMAKEMRGDPDFSVAAISVSTMLSALSFSFWLSIYNI